MEDAISACYDALETDPDNVNIHEVLLGIWDSRGDAGTAKSVALNILSLDPRNSQAQEYLNRARHTMSPSLPLHSVKAKGKTRASHGSRSTSGSSQKNIAFYPELNLDLKDSDISPKAVLADGLSQLMSEAHLLHTELSELRDVPSSHVNGKHEDALDNLKAIAEGRLHEAVPLSSPPSVREASRGIVAAGTSERARSLLVEDFEAVAQWFLNKRPPSSRSGPTSVSSESSGSGSIDTLRTRLVSRKTLFLATLPSSLHPPVTDAFTQMERTHLARRYTNTETMLGDSVSDIPPEHFLATEDNYAWDMTELVQALASNAGTMRNPLTKHMFTPADISRILAHPLASSLKPVRARQDALRQRMSAGAAVHGDTLALMRSLGRCMLGDDAEDAGPSRRAMDEFLGHVATLPQTEQDALESLKIPARDSHTGAAYDYTVGEALNDAKTNVTCGHKVGDFLVQAAQHLESLGRSG